MSEDLSQLPSLNAQMMVNSWRGWHQKPKPKLAIAQLSMEPRQPGSSGLLDDSSSPHAREHCTPSTLACFSFPPLGLCLFTGCVEQAMVTFPRKSHSTLKKSKEFKIARYEFSCIFFGRFEHSENHSLTECSRQKRKKKWHRSPVLDSLLPCQSQFPPLYLVPRQEILPVSPEVLFLGQRWLSTNVT